MSQKRHTVDQIIAKLRRADVLLGKGTNVPELCKQLEIVEQTYLPLAAGVWWHAAEDGQGTQSPAERECLAEEDGRRAQHQTGILVGATNAASCAPPASPCLRLQDIAELLNPDSFTHPGTNIEGWSVATGTSGLGSRVV